MGLADLFFSIATGSRSRRALLTPVGFLVGAGMFFAVISGGIFTDRLLGLPPLLPGIIGSSIGILLLVAGFLLVAWCFGRFLAARGTPVPFNPPRELVTDGPYARVRNPMLAGGFVFLLGGGFFLHSISMVVLWAPAFILLNAVELLLVEEPELERRFGEPYRRYKRRVPMFFPRIFGNGRR